VRTGDAVHVAEQPARLGLLRGHVAQGDAVGPGARGGEGQERAAPGARLLQVADPAQGPRRVRGQDGLEAIAQERLHRALVFGVGLDGVGHDSENVDSVRSRQQRPHALVEGRVRGHHLLERGQAAGQAVALALMGLRLPRRRVRFRARGRAARGSVLARARQLRAQDLRLGRVLPRGGAHGLDAPALRLELRRLRGQLQEVGGRARGISTDGFARVLVGGDAAQEIDLGVARRVLLRFRGALSRRRLRLGRFRLSRFVLRGRALDAQACLVRAALVDVIGEGADARPQLFRFRPRLRRPRVRLRDLLAAVAAAPLVAVHGQRELAQPRPHLFQPRLVFVEGGAPHLHLRLFRLQGDGGGLLALAFGGEALREGVGLRTQVQEAPAIQHALDRLHLFAHRAIAPRLAGLALERLELLLDLVDDVVHAEQVLLRGFELELGLAAARLVLRDAGGFFDEGAPVRGLAGEDEADLALLDDRVGLGPEAGVHEQLVDVLQAADLAVHQVFALAVAIEPAGHDAFRRAVRAVAVEAADLEVHLGHARGLARLASIEDDVLHGRAAEALRTLLAEDPRYGVGDVALTTAVGPNDPRHAALEGQFLLIAERLEADDLDPIEAHRRPTPRYSELAATLAQGVAASPDCRRPGPEGPRTSAK
jgi:hypothetical protein